MAVSPGATRVTVCSRETLVLEAWAGLEPRLEQGPQTRVDSDDVIARDGAGEHLIGVVEDVVDVGGGGHRLVDVLGPGGVSGSDDPVAGPGDDEQDRLLGAQEDSRLGVDRLLGDDDVDALGGQHLQTSGVGGQVLGGLRPHTGGVDGALGTDLVDGAGLEIGDGGAAHVAAGVGEEAGDPRAVGSQGAQADGSAHEVDDEAGVVDAGVVEADGSGEPGRLKSRGERARALAPQVLLNRDGAVSAGAGQGESVVHAHPDGRVGALVGVFERP